MKCGCAESKLNDRITAAHPLNQYRFFSQINSLGSTQLLASEGCKDTPGEDGGCGSLVPYLCSAFEEPSGQQECLHHVQQMRWRAK